MFSNNENLKKFVGEGPSEAEIKMIIKKISDTANLINKKSRKCQSSYIVVGGDVANSLQSLDKIKAD
jgi:hypothetical protein